MIGDWIEATSSTGGSGALTLADVPGSPNYTHVFGASGSRLVSYTVLEFTDSSRATIAKSETGVGSINLSTGVLTRTVPRLTWNGTTYNNTTPSALAFGSTPDNIRITCGPHSWRADGSSPFYRITSPSSAFRSFHTIGYSAGSNNTVQANLETYVPHYWAGGAFDGYAIWLDQASATGPSGLKVAIYEVSSDGGPGAMLVDMQSTPLDIRNGGTTGVFVSATLAAPVYLPPGWYYVAMLAQVTAGVRGQSITFHSVYTPLGSYPNGGGTPITFATRSGSYASGLADPANFSGAAITSASIPRIFVSPVNA